jgi:hypothetical protein
MCLLLVFRLPAGVAKNIGELAGIYDLLCFRVASCEEMLEQFFNVIPNKFDAKIASFFSA